MFRWWTYNIKFLLIALSLLILAIIISASPQFKSLCIILNVKGGPLIINQNVVVNAITLAGIIIAVWQIFVTHSEIRIFTETKELSSFPLIVQKINEILESAKEIYFMANVPAIGATGASPKIYDPFSMSVAAACERLGDKFHMIYVNVELAPAVNGLKEFYEKRGVVGKKLKETLDKSKILHKTIIPQSDYHPKAHVNEVAHPHFIIVEPGSGNRKAVIWNLNKADAERDYAGINGIGFYTKSPTVINTYLRVFKDTLK